MICCRGIEIHNSLIIKIAGQCITVEIEGYIIPVTYVGVKLQLACNRGVSEQGECHSRNDPVECLKDIGEFFCSRNVVHRNNGLLVFHSIGKGGYGGSSAGVTGAGALDGVTALEEVAVCAGSALRVPVSGSKLLFDA